MPSNDEYKLIDINGLSRFKTNVESKYGAANGVAQLDSNAKVPVSQLPSAVFSVEQAEDLQHFPQTGSTNKLYVDLDESKVYYWDSTLADYVCTSIELPSNVFNVVTAVDFEHFPQTGEDEKIYIDKSTNNQYRWDTTESEYVSISSPESVKYTSQSLTTAQKTQARTNIDAAASSDIPDVSDVVRVSSQSFSGDQKIQARTNIGAASESTVSGLSSTVSDLNDRLNNFGDFVREVTATDGGINVLYDSSIVPTTIETGLVFDGGMVDENNYLYLKNGNTVLPNDVFEPIKLPEGGGGGPTGPTVELSSVVRPSTVRNGNNAIVSFVATASDDAQITVRWYVNNQQVHTEIDDSGSTFSLNVKDYLNESSANTVRVEVESESGASLSRKWTITTYAFAISWGNSIEPIMLNTANTNVYVQINVSSEQGSSNVVVVTVGNRTISRNASGSMTLTIAIDKTYFTTGVNTVTASMFNADDPTDRADDIHFTMIWGTGATAPIVAFAESSVNCTQYDLVDIDYFVFDPNNETATYTIQVDSETPRQLTASRQMQKYQYAPAEHKTYTVTLTCGSAHTSMTLIAAQSPYNLNYYIDDSLVYVLDPTGHSNSDADRAQFGNLVFDQGFDWQNGGFMSDDKGSPAFVVKKRSRVTLPRCLFEDSDANGKTVDLSFKVTNSDQYDAIAMQELNNGSTKGIILRANNGELRLNNVVGKEFRYCEDSRIDMSILVENNIAQRVATVWLDGIPSNVNKYTAADTLVQNENELVIGSEHCDVWIYAIRVYNVNLTKQQMLQNYVSEGSTTNEKVQRYQVNMILDNTEKVSYANLHQKMPNLTIVRINADRMTTSKSDKVPADITITDGTTVLELPKSDGTVFMVQGTSSSAYGRSAYNLDMDFKNTGKTYKISEDAIAVNYLNIKVNVASSENANNINAVDWYNTYQPYITEPRTRPGVRDTIEGKPCAVFFTNTSDSPVWFSSQLVQPNEEILYAMGDLCNSKKNKAVFGQDGSGEHPTLACIEVSGNDTEPERFRSTAAEFNPEADDGKGQWETEETDPVTGELKTIKHFEWRMNPSSANLNTVVASWDAVVAWVVSTIGDSAKFKSEVGNYFAIDSLLYHFLFIEYFAGYDNVSKNTFYSYDWDETANKYLWNIKCAYDMDTILAADNDGIPFGDYGLDYGDTVDGTPSGRQYFNAVTNTIWVNIKEAFQSELSSMYISLRSRGAWNAQNIISKWDNYQAKRPHVTMILDAYNKYIKPYKTDNVVIGTETKSYDDSYLPRLNGSKIYWRKQFLTYQTSYMDGKYGYYNTTDTMSFRTNGTEGTKNFTVKSYAKTYMTMIKDSNRVASQKVEAGQTTVFNNVSVGNNTTLYVTPDRLVQYVRPLNETKNSTFVAAGAAKLTEAILGGTTINNDWPAGTGLSIPSVLLKDLSIRNMTQFSDALNLSANVELETLDTRGTNAGLITLPSFAPVTTVQLNACTGISAINLSGVQTFTMESGNNLVSVRIENCNSAVSTAIATYLLQAVNVQQEATRRIRAIGINWSFNNLDALSKIASTWKGYNNLGQEQDAPVVTGTIHTVTLSKKKLEIINNVWGEGDVEDHLDEINKVWSYGNLTITYDSLIPYYEVTFLNVDNSPIKDKSGNDYVQYIDYLNEAYDPVLADEINTPTYIDPAGQYRYTYTGWSNLSGAVVEDKIVKAEYSTQVLTYTVRWFDKIGGTELYKMEDVEYGSEAVYDPNLGIPEMHIEESSGFYNVFTGWDKSTGYITGDIDVYANWDRARIPEAGTDLKNMSVSQIYGIAKTNRASSYFNYEDYTDIQIGRDFSFSNVQSEVLLQNRYFDGTEIYKTNVKLFDENAPSFTLAIDYEYTENSSTFSLNNSVLISCAEGDSEGFNIQYFIDSDSENIRVLWGDKIDVISHGLNRGIVVLRHRKGSKSLTIASDNGGRKVQYICGNFGADEGDTEYRYAGYNDAIHFAELARAQETSTNAVLSFGAKAYGSAGFTNAAKGWIHWCKIWYDDLGTDNIKQLACWPHETWRMQYRGNGLYNKDDGVGLLDSASFIASAPLPQFYEFYPSTQSTTEGSWKNSILRSFVNNRCFKALPYAWQSIIAPVRITTKGGADNLDVLEYTSDKLYVPSYADMLSVSTGLISSESRQVPWFTANKYRIKFMGINISEDAQIIDDINDDPTLYIETYHVKEGDIWIPTGSKIGYIYLSSETAAKHGFVGGRKTNNMLNNIAATGAQGGLWVRAMAYWTRTNANADEQYTVYPQGSVSTNWIYNQSYQRRAVVLMFSL